jgi:hypothetical protein
MSSSVPRVFLRCEILRLLCMRVLTAVHWLAVVLAVFWLLTICLDFSQFLTWIGDCAWTKHSFLCVGSLVDIATDLDRVQLYSRPSKTKWFTLFLTKILGRSTPDMLNCRSRKQAVHQENEGSHRPTGKRSQNSCEMAICHVSLRASLVVLVIPCGSPQPSAAQRYGDSVWLYLQIPNEKYPENICWLINNAKQPVIETLAHCYGGCCSCGIESAVPCWRFQYSRPPNNILNKNSNISKVLNNNSNYKYSMNF